MIRLKLLARVKARLLEAEDWRGLVTLAFLLGYFALSSFEIYLTRSYTLSSQLLNILTLILGFYFGEKSERRKRKRRQS